MTILGMVVIARPIQIGGQDGDEITVVLAAIGLAQFNTGNLCNSIPLIGWLELAGQQLVLTDRLFGKFWIDAARTKKQQLTNSNLLASANEIEFDREIVGQKLDWKTVVCQDTTDASCRNNNYIRAT